ncbi:hypothetical protein SS50377_27789 [Spironucleus salmonicida]|uniref:Uncharacterized protein n=1 Tax=Spironucleus salmonicida TaxID=348837 RepID=V6LQT9_9EUKA|nr:hypothetical protein SS50377_27789 [Spironucleus salmonicida]|eukprot:EST46950.1 Hypothetical protein SS50377_13009 [Spironucleus salmonicida]
MKFFTQEDLLAATFKQDRLLVQAHEQIKQQKTLIQQKDLSICKLENQLEISQKQLKIVESTQFQYFQNNNLLLKKLSLYQNSTAESIISDNIALKKEIRGLYSIIRNSRKWQKQHGITELKELIYLQQQQINQMSGESVQQQQITIKNLDAYQQAESINQQLSKRICTENSISEQDNHTSEQSILETSFRDNESLQSQVNWLQRENASILSKYESLVAKYEDVLHSLALARDGKKSQIFEDASEPLSADGAQTVVLQHQITEFQENYIAHDAFQTACAPKIEQETPETQQILGETAPAGAQRFSEAAESARSSDAQGGDAPLQRKLALTSQQLERYHAVVVAQKREAVAHTQTISAQRAEINQLELKVVDLEFAIAQTAQEAEIWGQSSQNAVEITNRLLQSTEVLRKSLCSDED